MSGAPTRKGRGRLQLIGIVAIAVVPLLLSYVLYQRAQEQGVWGTTNKGELLDPMPRAADLADSQGEAIAGRWWLVMVVADRCEATCAEAVPRLAALHVRLQKDAERVRRGVLGRASLADASFEKLRGELDLRPGVYIVDPLGNVVLRYEFEAAGGPIFDDLKKLLKVSQIG